MFGCFAAAVHWNGQERLNMVVKGRIGIVGELWAFMRVRKKWWLGPIIFMLLLLGLLIVFTQGSALAPFIYTLF
jgi:hypothetical protein